MSGVKSRADAVHILLIALFCAPFFINLGANALWDANETWYAEIPREMLELRQWLVPYYNYAPWFEKPPLWAWLIGLSYSALGVTEFAVRLPGALLAPLTVGMTYLLSISLYPADTPAGRRTGLISALALATMLKFMVYARQFPGDIFLAFFVTTSLTCFVRALRATSRVHRWAYVLLAYAAVALGVLDKGLLGLLPLPILGLLFLTLRTWRPLWLIASPAGILLLLAITLPWFIFMYGHFGWAFISQNLVEHTFHRYTTGEFGVRPFYFYVGVYLAETLPWSLFIVPALAHWGRWLGSEWRETPQREVSGSLPLLPFVWFVFVFLFFSASVGKRAVYLVVLYPAAALLIGHYFAAQTWERGALEARFHRVVTGLLAAACLAAAPLGLLAYCRLEIKTALIGLPVGVVLGLGLGLCWLMVKSDFTRQAYMLALAGLGITFSIALLLPKLAYYQPLPRFAQVVNQRADADAEIGTFRVDKPSLMFYTRRKIFQSSDDDEMIRRLEGEREVYFVTMSDQLPELQQRTASTLEVINTQPMLELKWRSFLGPRAQALQLVLVRKPPSAHTSSPH